MRKLLTAVLLILSTAATLSARNDFGMRYLTMSDGLPSNTVRCIVQDGSGFIWFGTDNGLCRYDGYSIVTYRNPYSRFEQFVCALAATDKGLLVGTEKGAYLFDFRTEQFSPLCDGKVKGHVSGFSADKDGAVWAATTDSGLYRCTPRGECRNYPFKAWRGNVSQVYTDNSNHVWALSNAAGTAPCRLNRATGRFEPAAAKGAAGDLCGMAMTQTAGGDILIGTWQHGLVRLNADGSAETVFSPSADGVGRRIHSLLQVSDKEVLAGCDDGLVSCNPDKKTWRLLAAAGNGRPGISERFVYCIAKDREGGVWTGTFYGGVTYASPMGKRFATYRDGGRASGGKAFRGNVVSRFCEDARKRIWVATDDGGLNLYDPHTDGFAEYPGEKEMSAYNIHGLLAEGGALWVGTYGNGVKRLDTKTGKITSIPLEGGPNSSCYYLFKDSRGTLWATSMDGASVYDAAKGQFRKVKSFRSLTVSVAEDKRGDLWFATQGAGLWRRGKSGKWRQYLPADGDDPTALPSTHVNCVAVGGDGAVYAATDRGAVSYRPGTDDFSPLPVRGQSADFTGVIATGDELWLSTARGLLRYAPGEEPQVYNRHDGLTSDQFLPDAATLSSDGRLYFGTPHGFNAFYPYQIEQNRNAPVVYLTGVEIQYKPVEAGSDKLKEELNHLRQLDISHGDNIFTITFSALSYISPEKNQYAYRLDGFDNDWNYVGSENKATYTNLSAGTYTFRIKASNNDGVWSERETRLRIVVHPPFYWSIPAKVLYAVLGACLIYVFTHYRLRRERNRHVREIERLERNKEQEVRDARLRFFTMIAHEIRTPVSLIIGPLENLKAEIKGNPTVDVIDRNAQRLLNLVNQLLDFSKVQQEGMPVHFKTHNVAQIVRSVAVRFEPTLRRKGIRFVTELPAEDFNAVMDGEAVTKIISNLMTNASKYTRDYIRLACRPVDAERFRITVEDNGDGVADGEKEKIFAPFYQVKDNKPGTGIGLSIVQSLAKAHGGTAEVQSSPGKGAAFVVTLPITQAVEDDGGETETAPTPAPTPTTAETAAAPVKSVMLVAEDDADMREFIAGNFRKDYEVMTAENGAEALRLLETNAVAFVVSDWMMPEMDGAELCRHMRRNELTCHIPFIMLTAKTDDGSKTEGMQCGADAYIEKPFSMKYLEACVNNLLGMRRMLQNKYSHTPLEPITEVAQTTADSRFLQRVNDIIETNISNPDMSVVFVAGQLGIGRSTLFSKVKGLLDITPNEMIQLVRLKKAARLLREDDYRISEVCYMVGFSSPSYFAKCFQKQFGMTPTEFVSGKKN